LLLIDWEIPKLVNDLTTLYISGRTTLSTGNYLAAVDVLDSHLSKKEVHKVFSLERADELRIVQPSTVVDIRPEGRSRAQRPDDGGVCSAKVYVCGHEQSSFVDHEGSDVRVRGIRALGDTAFVAHYMPDVLHLSPRAFGTVGTRATGKQLTAVAREHPHKVVARGLGLTLHLAKRDL